MNVCGRSWPLNNPTPQRSNVLNLRHGLIGNLLKRLNVLGLRRAPYMSRTQASATDPSLDRGLTPTPTLMFALDDIPDIRESIHGGSLGRRDPRGVEGHNGRGVLEGP